MRRADFPVPDPEIVESLEAIDATLAGRSVDPRHVEFAELALLLRDERPRIPPALAAALDDRVAARFATAGATGGRPRRRALPRAWLFAPAAGFAASLIVAVVIVVSQGTGSHPPQRLVATSASSAPARAAKVPATPGRAPRGLTPGATAAASGSPEGSVAAGPDAFQAASAATLGAAIVQAPVNGRKIVQSAQLALTTRASRIDAVAQEVFDVVGRFSAIVQSSNVTAASGPDGYAQFQLSIPSGSLGQAMAALSELPYARVASRTDTTQDVNDQYQSDVRALADARARRASLLRQLANAGTQPRIDSLTVQLHDAEASISSDEATLRGLDHRIGYSQVSVTINGAMAPVPVRSSGRAFTLGRAAHDAGRVLTVAAGVALIAFAALTPVALIGALAGWIMWALRRRRREQALDLV